jgi:hypothetical protein
MSADLEKVIACAKRMSIADYHSHAAISKSGLDLIHRSPAHYIECKLHPPEPSPSMIIGQAAHDSILQPELFHDNFAITPDLDRRTKAGKEAFELFCLQSHGKTVLTREQAEIVSSVTQSVYAHPSASKLLSDGHPELSYFWTDEKTGVPCRARPDFLREHHIIVDVKTTQDASLTAFMKSVANYRYHVQAAFYLDGVTAVTGEHYDTFVMIAVETKAPYAVACYVLDSEAIAHGRREYAKDLAVYAECLKTSNFPAYGDDLKEITLPGWAWTEGN